MKALLNEFPITVLSTTLEVSRSGFYQWNQSGQGVRAAANEELDAEIGEVYRAHRGRYGSPRVTQVLKKKGVKCGENRVARRMQIHGLAARKRRAYVPRTTDSRHGGPICANLLLEREAPKQPNQVWLSDITYVATGQGWLYLVGFLDAATRRLVGWSVGPTARPWRLRSSAAACTRPSSRVVLRRGSSSIPIAAANMPAGLIAPCSKRSRPNPA